MAEIAFAAMRTVAERLDRLGLEYAFLGGSVVGLLLDRPELSPVRPTDDVDVVIEVVSRTRYAETEAKLRELKFDHDMRPGAPRCRWVLGNLTVDIMPAEGGFLGLNTTWFREALSSASNAPIPGGDLRVISPVAFLATKYVAFLDRGAGDYYASHDLEDLIAVIDGRERIVAEANAALPGLRDYTCRMAGGESPSQIQTKLTPRRIHRAPRGPATALTEPIQSNENTHHQYSPHLRRMVGGQVEPHLHGTREELYPRART